MRNGLRPQEVVPQSVPGVIPTGGGGASRGEAEAGERITLQGGPAGAVSWATRTWRPMLPRRCSRGWRSFSRRSRGLAKTRQEPARGHGRAPKAVGQSRRRHPPALWCFVMSKSGIHSTSVPVDPSRRARLSPRGAGRPFLGASGSPRRIRLAEDGADGLPRGADGPPRGASACPAGRTARPAKSRLARGRAPAPRISPPPPKRQGDRERLARFQIRGHLLASRSSYLYHSESVKSQVDRFTGPDAELFDMTMDRGAHLTAGYSPPSRNTGRALPYILGSNQRRRRCDSVFWLPPFGS